jgi:phage shock protein E
LQLAIKGEILKQLVLSLILLTFMPPLAAEQGNKPLIIDVRTPAEWNEGHLLNAKHIEWQEIGERIVGITFSKNETIYVYCRTGNRSGKAKEILDQLGYSDVINAGAVTEAQGFIDSAEAAHE